jgi:hypothetical protein
MPRSKHSIFKSRLLAIIFLFLNAVCIASPVTKNTADEYQSLISLSFGHDVNTFESEENQLPRASFISRSTSRSSVTLKNHICTQNSYRYSAGSAVQKYSNSSIASSALLQKPGYYACLFRCTLF